jgi:chitin-binding protein
MSKRFLASALTLLATVLASVAGLGGRATPVYAHGSMQNPMSRVYECYLEGPEAPKSAACRAALAAGGSQAFYDWPEVNLLNAAGQSRSIIPDGHLCSAGRAKYQGFDLPRRDWPATTLPTSGSYTFTWLPTVKHRGSFQLYVTRDGYDPTQPLRWSDLEATPFATISDPDAYSVTAPIPAGKHGRHLIYVIWQRSDSPEAFYSCSDVVFGTEPPPPPPGPNACPDPWSPVVAYGQGVTAGFGGHAWQARFWTRGDQPGAGDPQWGPWADLGGCVASTATVTMAMIPAEPMP